MSVHLLHAARTLALLLVLAATTTGFAATAQAQNAPLTRDQKTIRDMRKSIAQHWLADPEFRKLGPISGTVRFELDSQGRLVGEPQVSMPGKTLSKRLVVARFVTRAIKNASPFPPPPKNYPLKFILPFSFNFAPEPAPCKVRSCGTYPRPQGPVKANIGR